MAENNRENTAGRAFIASLVINDIEEAMSDARPEMAKILQIDLDHNRSKFALLTDTMIAESIEE